MMRKFSFLVVGLLCYYIGYTQQLRPANSEKIYTEIAQLHHLVNVLYMAAHPDDENTRLLAWLVNEKHIRTGYLSLTRGDGGQNILGSEQGEALGLIRTHELMEARKLDGAEQYFTRAIDFGFSKTYEETFTHWNEDSLIKDAVWVFRKFRPDVVICRFPPNTQAGHGQHAASAIIAAEAFEMSGDPAYYQEQLSYYNIWQPKRLLWNTYRFGDRNTTSEDQFKLKVGQYEPTLGVGVGELAGMSRSIHKSQGAGTPSVPGIQTEYFKLIDGDTLSTSLFDGIDITWGRVDRKDIGEDIMEIQDNFNFLHPDESLPALLKVRKKIETVKDEYWKKEKLQEIDKIILDCTGLMAEVVTKQPQAIAGAKLPFTLRLISRSEIPVSLKGIFWKGDDTLTNIRLVKDSLYSLEHIIEIPKHTPPTQPYWLATQHEDKDLFKIDPILTGLPETPNELTVELEVHVGKLSLSVPVPLSYKKLDPLKGDVVEQLRIVPDATVSFSSGLYITNVDGSIDATVSIHTNKPIYDATLILSGNGQNLHEIGRYNLGSIRSNIDTVIYLHIIEKTLIGNFSIEHTDGKTILLERGQKNFTLIADLKCDGHIYDKSINLIQYNHLPTLQYFTPAITKVIKKDWKCRVKHIGYIEGAGDNVPAILRQTGLDVTILKEADMTDAGKLKKYDAIITGIRAVNVEKRMYKWLPVLLKYTENGGTLVMQYNTLQDMSTVALGPYPFTLSDKRVTEEDAKVTFNDSKCRLLNYPNKITDADLTGWVQERGLYFASKWDDHYQTVFTMNDKEEEPQKGSTLYTKYGKGNYIYTSLSFFRQLPAGNTGAIRLMMNMVSVGK